MKNAKDKNIVKLLLVFLAYYLISFYMPNMLRDYSKLINMIAKDLVMIIVVILIYYKDVSREYKSFRKSKKKWTVIFWAIGIIAITAFMSYCVSKSFPNYYNVADSNNSTIESYYKISKAYAFFKTVIFTGIVEVVLFSLSFRKVFNKNIIFVIVSSLVYTYFNYLFTGINFYYFLNPLIIRFIPYVLCNIAYIKNNNNIIYLMGIMIIKNSISFALLLLG